MASRSTSDAPSLGASASAASAFVQVSEQARIVRPGRKTWDIALAQIVPTPLRARAVELVGPYLVDDQAVLLRRGLARPHSLADLRRLQLCAIRGSRGAGVAAHRVTAYLPHDARA